MGELIDPTLEEDDDLPPELVEMIEGYERGEIPEDVLTAALYAYAFAELADSTVWLD